ncbi:hypothetical protein DKX38_014200 [Salix brachista]|uniref:Uncharacterized protein n=1 Tax=Salix brachista TaxID=2182728 RepID=A0A5N5LGY6_9ROSI|nr:hypothetical protein DKX38_014200 [Salix brachista]
MGGTDTMRREAKKRGKLVIILLAPFQVLRKAGNFYMKFVADCSNMVGDDYNGMVGGPTAQMSTLPKSFSSNSTRESSMGYSASGRRSGSLGSASGRRSGPLQSNSGRRSGVLSESASGRRSHEMQPGMHYREAEVTRRESTMRYSNGMAAMRSYSVGIGKIGKIDEEKPCSFREDEEDDKVDVCPRSRSQAAIQGLIVSLSYEGKQKLSRTSSTVIHIQNTKVKKSGDLSIWESELAMFRSFQALICKQQAHLKASFAFKYSTHVMLVIQFILLNLDVMRRA